MFVSCISSVATVFLHPVIAGLAFLFSLGILLQILGCALYNNWWPMLTALMYVMVPMPCLFFGGGSASDFISADNETGWEDAAKFLTGFSAVGSIAIPAILRHADLIATGAMFIEFLSFGVLLVTVLLYQRISREDEW
ncbi:vacuolar protein sorting 55 domain-containing protein [Klebsormidium nitens]|uniref:Vacuolar protein sorting 55 domain-containing protein n=1 Tax=Klebsormidium nitens TaxID=105231 RepID=A0A1Y1IMQ8_KLENI|nr:vacuolar protein sorting 55 domain-containing protein [Klebsormidium nitens]|eukprot:GAQ90431.1 vacuolar protein sorting 55 domain-containing protein [Klebsormidium nitens]